MHYYEFLTIVIKLTLPVTPDELFLPNINLDPRVAQFWQVIKTKPRDVFIYVQKRLHVGVNNISRTCFLAIQISGLRHQCPMR